MKFTIKLSEVFKGFARDLITKNSKLKNNASVASVKNNLESLLRTRLYQFLLFFDKTVYPIKSKKFCTFAIKMN